MQEQASGKRPRPRIETLADLIFGLSLSIGSIALIASPATSPDQINGHIVAFAFTFLILITCWIIYTTFMSVLPVETPSFTFINVVLLLLVALVPYLLNGVEITDPSLTAGQASAIRDYASSLFALDLASILAVLAVFAHVISIEEKKLVAPEIVALFRAGRNRMVVISVIMAASIAPQFWQVSFFGVPARLYVWYIPLISYWVGRAVNPASRTYKV
ncbi:MAG: hypothetical protein LYZ70_03225 [Nitrososphaerales archaeon]|nr:hypothetical protein [Nitrososphaerales archaeon]